MLARSFFAVKGQGQLFCVGCLAASLTSTHWVLVQASKRSPDITSVFWGDRGKIALDENHWVRETGENHQGEEAAPISQRASNLKQLRPCGRMGMCVQDTAVHTEVGIVKDGEGAKSHQKAFLLLQWSFKASRSHGLVRTIHYLSGKAAMNLPKFLSLLYTLWLLRLS